MPLSHPFVERLIGTIRRECLDRTLFWTAADSEMKLLDFQRYYNGASLEGDPLMTTERLSQYRNVAYFGASPGMPQWGALCVVALTEHGARRVIEAEHPHQLYILVGEPLVLTEAAYTQNHPQLRSCDASKLCGACREESAANRTYNEARAPLAPLETTSNQALSAHINALVSGTHRRRT